MKETKDGLVQLNIRVTPEVKATFQEKAKLSGMTNAEYVTHIASSNGPVLSSSQICNPALAEIVANGSAGIAAATKSLQSAVMWLQEMLNQAQEDRDRLSARIARMQAAPPEQEQSTEPVQSKPATRSAPDQIAAQPVPIPEDSNQIGLFGSMLQSMA